MKMSTEEAIMRWNKAADSFISNYDENGGVNRKVLLNPAIFELLGEVSGKVLLDAGCGEGYLSRILAQQGASITAVDYSERMLELAKERTTDNSIKYEFGNIENMHFLPSQSFDKIVSNMVIQDLEKYELAIKEMYRLLKRDGTFVFSILHPCFITPNSGWIKDTKGQKLYWKVDRYFYEGVYDQNFPANSDDKVVYYHRTLMSYMKTFRNAGFTLNDIIEPKASSEDLLLYPKFKEDLNCPNFIVFQLSKKG
ncbi:class I SAM-dependent methyltransferase [Oceanobacillus kimchii]|uniref:class I SAM-dependent methyltransferase n=1 Tax=Oceanobacillus kimchii TaxID=746691 RepID=UPI003B01D6F9